MNFENLTHAINEIRVQPKTSLLRLQKHHRLEGISQSLVMQRLDINAFEAEETEDLEDVSETTSNGYNVIG